jgi:hypothetical protein
VIDTATELVIGNRVPSPQHDHSGESAVHCAMCCTPVIPNERGNFFSVQHDAWWVCDQCGIRERPDLANALAVLRQDGRFTVTNGGARIDQDADAWHCPVCGVESGEVAGWHVVDREHGRPVCADCVLDVDPAIVALVPQLSR